jgi:Intron-binding protein aquarius N-terminus
MQRLQPRRNEASGAPEFMGWSRMAIKIESFVVVEVARPRVGEIKPAAVTAELVIDLAQFKRNDIREEWDELKEHDVLFLLTVQPPSAKEAAAAMASGGEDAIARAAGLQCVAICKTLCSSCSHALSYRSRVLEAAEKGHQHGCCCTHRLYSVPCPQGLHSVIGWPTGSCNLRRGL